MGTSSPQHVDLRLDLFPTQAKFVLSEKRYVWLIGPEGEGKTFALIAALLQHQSRLDPFLSRDPKGNAAPMKGAIIRDTHTAIKMHTIESIKNDFPGVFIFRDDNHLMLGPGMRIDLFGMRDEGANNKIQGGGYHLISIEEPAPILHTGNAGIRHASFLFCARRIRGKKRPVEEILNQSFLDQETYDRLIDRTQINCECEMALSSFAAWKRHKGEVGVKGHIPYFDAPKRLQVTMNPAEKSHWTYKEAIENPLEDTDVFQIPPGENKMLSVTDRKARDQVFRDRPDLAARYEKGQFADTYPGVKVTPEYQEDIHQAKSRLLPIPGVQYFRFWDGGLNPTCVICCITPTGQLWFLDCVMYENGGMRQLIDNKLRPLLARPRYKRVAMVKRLWRDIGDASLANREQGDSEHRASLIINEMLGADFEQGVQRWEPRREAMKFILSHTVGGRPFVQVNPVATEGEPFNRVQSAFIGGYAYKVTAVGTVLRDGPDKNVHSHVGDAISHGVAKLFLRKPVTNYKYDQSRGLKRAKGYGVG